MKRWLLVAASAILLSGCTIRVTGDASMLQKYDRPTDTWSVESKTGPAAPAVAPAKEVK